MMKPLRKRHLQIWAVSALLLPAGIIFAWRAIPNQQPVKLLQTTKLPLLPVIKQTKNVNEYTINIRTNNDNTASQLEWKNKIPLKVPSAVIYSTHAFNLSTSFNPREADLVGRIETRGDYAFPLFQDTLKHDPLHFILYDFIHEKIIDTINFHP